MAVDDLPLAVLAAVDVGDAQGQRRDRAAVQSVSFTLDRYGHLYPEADRALRDRLDRFTEAAGDA